MIKLTRTRSGFFIFKINNIKTQKMKKTLLSLFAMLAYFGYGQTVYFQDDFSVAANFSNWTLYNLDNLTPDANVSAFAAAWVRVDRNTYGGPAGDFCAGSTSWFDPAGTANRWLVSPAINIPVGSNAILYWDAKAQDTQFPDGYEVRISTSNTQAAVTSGTVLFSIAQEAPTWQSRNVSLAAYAGQTVHISFRNNSNDKFLLLVDNIVVSDPLSVPGCATLTAPANNATNIPSGNVTLTWTAPTTGGAVTSYDIFFDTTDGTTLLGNTTQTTVNITGVLPSSTYFWKAVPKNSAGLAIGCTNFTFTTQASPFAPYCGPLAFTTAVEPITLVNFAGINYTAPNTIGGNAHVNQISTSGNVSAGATIPVTFKGNTDGDFTNRFIVFIDWNQNGTLDDTGEVYFGDGNLTILNSTGLDAIQAVGNIVVPANAAPGNTRMRVVKQFGTTNMTNPCLGTAYGQAIDFTLSVTNLNTNIGEFSKEVSLFPNPATQSFEISTGNQFGNIQQVSVTDINGRVVKSFGTNQSSYDISDLNTGIYMVEIRTENGVETKKLIKK